MKGQSQNYNEFESMKKNFLQSINKKQFIQNII